MIFKEPVENQLPPLIQEDWNPLLQLLISKIEIIKQFQIQSSNPILKLIVNYDKLI